MFLVHSHWPNRAAVWFYQRNLLQEDKTSDLEQFRVPSDSTEAAQCTFGALLTFDTDNTWNCWLPGAPRGNKVLPAGSLRSFLVINAF